MSWLPHEAEGSTAFERAFALRPNLFADYRAFHERLWESDVDVVLLELARLRIAQLHGCAEELAVRTVAARDAGLDEDKIARLPRAGSDPRFGETERACVAFAELFAVDPHAITDADAARVVDALGEPGMVAFVEALALFDGFMRFRRVLGIDAPAAE